MSGELAPGRVRPTARDLVRIANILWDVDRPSVAKGLALLELINQPGMYQLLLDRGREPASVTARELGLGADLACRG